MWSSSEVIIKHIQHNASTPLLLNTYMANLLNRDCSTSWRVLQSFVIGSSVLLNTHSSPPRRPTVRPFFNPPASLQLVQLARRLSGWSSSGPYSDRQPEPARYLWQLKYPVHPRSTSCCYHYLTTVGQSLLAIRPSSRILSAQFRPSKEPCV